MTSTPNTNADRELLLSAPTKVFGDETNVANNSNSMNSPLVIDSDESRQPSEESEQVVRDLSYDSTPQSPPHQDEENEESEQERLRREEEESIALAQALMAEEAMASAYYMSYDYLRNNRDQFSEEDLAALQAAMEEDEVEEEIDEALEEDDDGGLSYELMLRLGERLGDVKSERWAQIAQSKIDQLPTFKFDLESVKDKDENDCHVKCLVCQFAYEKDEELRKLPCSHCFHAECVDQWLKSKDFCPYCRTAIVEE